MTTTGEIYDRLDEIQLSHDEYVSVVVHFAKSRPSELSNVLDQIVARRKS